MSENWSVEMESEMVEYEMVHEISDARWGTVDIIICDECGAPVIDGSICESCGTPTDSWIVDNPDWEDDLPLDNDIESILDSGTNWMDEDYNGMYEGEY